MSGEEASAKRPGLLHWIDRHLLPRVWYVHAPVVIMIRATPSTCLQTLTNAARPSTKRLHLRNLFASGRRYHIQAERDGFKMTTTSKLRWHYRRRTSSTAVMYGALSPLGEDMTRIQLRARINVGYLLDTFLIPGFMTTIIVFVPWNPLIIAVVLLALFTLSWAGHRSTAMLEASEMAWFVQKALDDLVPAEIISLGASNADIVDGSQDFEEAWRKFYEAHRDK
jgi:hypothetical protein